MSFTFTCVFPPLINVCFIKNGSSQITKVNLTIMCLFAMPYEGRGEKHANSPTHICVLWPWVRWGVLPPLPPPTSPQVVQACPLAGRHVVPDWLQQGERGRRRGTVEIPQDSGRITLGIPPSLVSSVSLFTLVRLPPAHLLSLSPSLSLRP